MSAVIVGSPSLVATAANAKVLRRQQYQKETNGLETLTETYTILTANRASLMPIKGTKHTMFSTASTKFARMVVETIAFSEQDGDLTEMTVTFVGLTSSSGLPPAVVRVTPVTGAGIYGPPVRIEVEYVSDSSIPQVLSGKLSSNFTPQSGKLNPIPFQINGTRLPPHPVAPFEKKVNLANLSTGQIYKDLGGTLFEYYGYIQQDTQIFERGEFSIVTTTYSEALRNGITSEFVQP